MTEPLLTREMFASDEQFWDALIRMARTGRVGPVEPAPPYPASGPRQGQAATPDAPRKDRAHPNAPFPAEG